MIATFESALAANLGMTATLVFAVTLGALALMGGLSLLFHAARTAERHLPR